MRTTPLAALLLAALALAAPGAAQAQLGGGSTVKGSDAVWKQMDDCKRQAFRKFPDYTAESNAKRDNAVKQCLAASNLPLLPPLSPGEGSGSSQR